MNQTNDTPRQQPEDPRVDMLPGESRPATSTGASDVDLLSLWLHLWANRWLIIAITSVFAVASIPFALTRTEWFRADVLLAPAEERSTSGMSRELGGLISLAGVSVGGGNSAEALAILQSREFASEFIAGENLLPTLFADQWDAENGQWLGDDPSAQPDMRDAVRLFRNDILSVSENTSDGLVSVSVQWTDPKLAAHWANLAVKRINAELRQRALSEAELNVAYLQTELGRSNVLALQQSISRLLESEMQKVMLARGNEEFAFRVIDRAEVPKLRYRPNRPLICVLATILGGFLAALFVLTRMAVNATRRHAEILAP